MGKYGDINGSGAVTPSDLTAMYEYLVGNVGLPSPLVSDDSSRKFFCMNMHKRWAYTGPSVRDLLKLDKVQSNTIPAEDFWEADYNNNEVPAWDEPESGKGSYVDMDGYNFITSFPTLIDYASWSGPETIVGQNPDMRETGGARMYEKTTQYSPEFNILPPTELYKTRTFEKSDFGLRSLAFNGDFLATTVYLHGQGVATPTTGSVLIYQRLPDGNYTFRHEIEVTDTSRAPVVEIHGDWLFVGNPINHVVLVYSLAELGPNQQFHSKNETPAKQSLSPTTIQGEQVTDWYGSYLHCSDGEHLFVGVDNGRLQQTDTLSGTYAVDCGYVDVYKLKAGTWEYVARITPPDLSIFQNENSYGFDSADIQFGGSVHHRKNDTSGAEYVAIGSPRADTDASFRGSDYIWNDNRMEGSVYIFKMTTVNDNPVFQFVHKESYQDAWFGSVITDSGEFEFGRSVVLDNDFSLWVASNPLSGSHVTRIPQLTLTSWDTANATHEQISSDRLGGVLATNGTDVVYGGPYKLRAFQATTTEDSHILKAPDQPPEISHKSADRLPPGATWCGDHPPIRPEVHDKKPPHELIKSYPREWGQPPIHLTKDVVELPFGYGEGSSTLARWIEDNATGDVRKSAYLRKLVDAPKPVEISDYHELWESGNPSIRVRVATDEGSVNVATPTGDILVERGSMLKYKSITRSTITLTTDRDLSGFSVYWDVNGKRMVGNTRLELLVCGEDMDVVVNFSKDAWAENDTPTMCVMTRAGETTILSKKEM